MMMVYFFVMSLSRQILKPRWPLLDVPNGVGADDGADEEDDPLDAIDAKEACISE